MLRDGQCSKCLVKCAAGASNPLHGNQVFKVHYPDARHLVHGDERTLKCVAEGILCWVADG